ncbi:hypothetical protein [Paraburkholderia terrae]
MYQESTSLYRTFSSKDELIAAFAEEQNRRFWQWWDFVVGRAPIRRVNGLKHSLPESLIWCQVPVFRGCPFANLAIEFPDRDYPGTLVAWANKEEVRRRLRLLNDELGARDPHRLGDQLTLLMEGA